MAAPIATLTVRISAQIAELQKSFADATAATEKFQKGFGSIATAATAAGTLISNAITKIASSIVSTLGSAISDAIKYSQQFQNAFLGLSSVATAFGSSTEAATAAAKSLAADGMLPLADAATGLKNLLSAGFNLKQSTDLMNAFKDSAAFGRQSSLSFGDAIRSATEGVKNQNSVLVDNAGVTKNLSVILKESGYVMQDLSDKTKGAGARQALYAGLLRETAAQQGDAAKAAGTYTGAMAALETAQKSLLATWGDAITRNESVQIALTGAADIFRKLTTASTDNKNAFYLVSDAVVFLIRTFANLLSAIDKIQYGFMKMDEVISGTIAKLLKGISDLAMMLLKILALSAKIPGGAAIVGNIAQDEIGGLSIIATKSYETWKAMSDQLVITKKRSEDVSAALQPFIKDLRTVADHAEAARGKMGELGESTKPEKLNQGGPAALTKEAIKAQKAFKKLLDDIHEFESGAGIVDISKMFNWNKAVQTAKITAAQINQELMLGFEGRDIPQWDFGSTIGDPNKAKQLGGIYKGIINDQIKQAATSIRPVMEKLAVDIPRIMGEAFSRGDNMWAAAATGAADIFSKTFAERLARSKAPGGPALTGGEKAMGLAATGISGFMGGYSMGAQGGKMKGALGGAASGAMSGFMVGGPVGAAVGGIAGLVGGLFGGAKKAKEERKALEANKQALLEQYGGMKNLQKLARSLNVDIQKAFDAKKPAQFEAAVQELNKALEEQKKRIEGLNNAVEGLNKRAEIFGQKFQKILDAKPPEGATKKQAAAFETNKAQSLQALAQSSGDEFDRLGLIARDTFAGLVKENGNAIEAMQQMAPTLQTLQDGVDKFGLTASTVTQEMIDNFKLVNDEAFKPLFDTIADDGQVLRGLFDAKALSPEGFQALATDIGASIQGIVDKGGDMSKTLALSQPVLQTLWEAQQQYGAVTDETTKSILKQAEEQGIVGEAMKGTNEKILDVLLAIGKVLNADLPTYFDALKKPADEAASSIEESFNKIDIPPIEVPYKFKQQGGGLPSGNSDATTGTLSVPALAAGGIVKHRTLALIGEAGPEAVVPLTGQGLGVTPSNYETTIYLDGEQIARSAARRIPRLMRALGVGH